MHVQLEIWNYNYDHEGFNVELRFWSLSCINETCHLGGHYWDNCAGALTSVQSLQLNWRSGTNRFHLLGPNLQMCSGDLTVWRGCLEGHQVITPGHQHHAIDYARKMVPFVPRGRVSTTCAISVLWSGFTWGQIQGSDQFMNWIGIDNQFNSIQHELNWNWIERFWIGIELELKVCTDRNWSIQSIHFQFNS